MLTHVTLSEKKKNEIFYSTAFLVGMFQPKDIFKSVSDAPEVEIKMTPSVPEVKQGDEITFICNVKRSNPKPDTFAWFKNGSPIDWRTSRYVRIIEARDHGPYTCTATNTVGTGTSQGLTLTVLCKFHKSSCYMCCMSESKMTEKMK